MVVVEGDTTRPAVYAVAAWPASHEWPRAFTLCCFGSEDAERSRSPLGREL